MWHMVAVVCLLHTVNIMYDNAIGTAHLSVTSKL